MKRLPSIYDDAVDVHRALCRSSSAVLPNLGLCELRLYERMETPPRHMTGWSNWPVACHDVQTFNQFMMASMRVKVMCSWKFS
uniref:Uncharacterized protein n=1 Tax=Setaria italica TaxID=4555 RepID=K4AHD9_SETIT